MNTNRVSSDKRGNPLLAVAILVSISVLLLGALAPAAMAVEPAAPLTQGGVTISSLPASTCTLVASTRTCELWAMTGSITMPTGDVLPIWGFADNSAGPAQIPGPVMIANVGETLEVVLHNQLAGENVSLSFPGHLNQIPDLEGVANGGTVTYTVNLADPGTFLYEAGLTPNGARQVAMGLYGALIVRPATPTQAYNDPATAFTDEALLVLSEIDPALNLDPNGFTMTEYAPGYRLINGKAYPETAEILTTAGNTLLLRYLNAGLESHWMGLLDLRQRIIASEGQLNSLATNVVAKTIASGQTIDALVTIPATAETDQRYALYDTNLLLHNANQRYTANGPLAFGGMMTFVRTVSGAAAGDAGPVATASVSPSPTTGVGGVTLSVRLDESTTGGQNVVAAEYFVDSIGPVGTGTALTVAAPGVVVDLAENISEATLAALPSGYPVFYVRGMDANNNWGFVASAVLNLDKLGPDSVGMSLTPDPTNGLYPVLLRATGDDHTHGNSNVVAGTYSLDGGAAQPMSLSRTDAPIVAMTATLPSAMLTALPEGEHPVAVSGQDSLGNWGVPGIITLTLDKTGPEAPLATLTPNLLDLSGAPPVTHVRMEATLSDALAAGVQSPLANAEAFIGNVGPNGTGFALFPTDGLFNEITEDVYFDIPIASFLFLAQGEHTVWVHGLDAARNWGAPGAVTMTIDRNATDLEGPVVSALNAAPNPTDGATMIALTAAAADPGLLSNVTAAEWFVGADPGVGQGLPLDASDGAFDSPSELLKADIPVGSWRNGQHELSVRARDSLMNWGPVASVRLQVQGNDATLILADSFENGLDAWSAAIGLVSTAPEAVLAPDGGTQGMQAGLSNGDPAYLSQLLPAGETSYHTSFYFDPNSAVLGAQEVDILMGLNGGTPVFGIQAAASTLNDYQVRGWVLANGILHYTDWYGISDEVHKLALSWMADASGSLSLTIDGGPTRALTGLDTSAYVLHEIRLGPSNNLDTAASGTLFFDGFVATRTMQFYIYLPVVFGQR